MIINLKVKTLDSQTHEFSIDNEITIRQFKDKIAEKTNIAAEQQRIIYCGRVLADDKQLKEYDVDGKVVHVAERPPPSARQSSSSSSTGAGAGGAGPTSTRRERAEARGMRTSPLFRALDGMVVGAMAIPMNAGVNNAQMAINPMTSSSSFCMNRITVARHMLDCANNIAAYLEDPERGLNNSSLDILAQGRWTMESTVVEVGITSSDIPQHPNFVEVLQGAVTAALRRNGNTNVTVVQLPTVFGSNEGENGNDDVADRPLTEGGRNGSNDADAPEPMDEGSMVIEGAIVIDTEESIDGGEEDNGGDEDGAADVSASSSASSSPLPTTLEGATASTESTTQSPTAAAAASGAANSSSDPNSMRRTGTRVLSEVIQQLRTVQTRLNPFIEQYYDLLQNEPTFEENDTAGRENAQRLFDRVSEAFHYMSHAQHAISDLMLDVSQPSPRHLCCRPILVEQSGYLSSNHFTPVYGSSNTGASSNLGTGSSSATVGRQQQAASAPTATANAAATEDPIDDPVAPSSAPPTSAAPTSQNTANVILSSVPSATGSNPTADLHRLQVARMIQAVVNSAPADTDLHVQVNAPNILTFGVPLNATIMRPAVTTAPASSSTSTATSATESPAATSASADNSKSISSGSSSPSSSSSSSTSSTENSPNTPSTTAVNSSTNSSNQARVTTATLPTTSTQTRSTARPQVQVGNIPPAWNGRVIPANMMSSFDRFLPCNSHHVRDTEIVGSGAATPQNNASNNNNNNIQIGRDQQREMLRDMFRRILPSRRTPATTTTGPTVVTTATSTPPVTPTATTFETTSNRQPSAAAAASATDSTASLPPTPLPRTVLTSVEINHQDEAYRCIQLRVHLLNFVKYRMFMGVPITADNIPVAVKRAIKWVHANLTFLPQFDRGEYDSRDSVEKLVSRSLPAMINLVNDTQESPAEFERRLGALMEKLFDRLFAILFVCVGRMNAELYWGQLMRVLTVSLNDTFRSEVLSFLQIYVNTQVPAVATNIADIQEYLVQRAATPMETDEDADGSEQANGPESPIQSTSRSSNQSPVTRPAEPEEPLPSVIVGTETWHRNFPNNWLPIITRDIQRQRDAANDQTPFSDSYISGMSAKRRKLIQSSKPTTDVKTLVSDSIRHAIQTTGVSNSTASNNSQTPDEVANAIATDTAVQASYCEALRSRVKERLKNEPDYKAEKFPQTSKYLNK